MILKINRNYISSMKTTIIKSPNAILGSRKFTIDAKKKTREFYFSRFYYHKFDL